MSELYENEYFIYNQVPVHVFCHNFDGLDIFTPLHWHRNIEFNLTTKGRILMNIDGDNQELYPGDWCVVNSSELHSNHWIDTKDHFEGIAVQISKSFMDCWMGKDVCFIYPSESGAAKEIEEVLIEFGRYHDRSVANNLEKMELVFHFLVLLKKYCVCDNAVSSKSDKAISNVKNIINYIDTHYQEALNLNDVAAEFHYTPAHLSRMFKEHIGYNFYAYIQNVRLMHCVEEMKDNPDVRLLECAVGNGFPNVKSFIQTFKKSFGCTPSEWLKKRNI